MPTSHTYTFCFRVLCLELYFQPSYIHKTHRFRCWHILLHPSYKHALHLKTFCTFKVNLFVKRKHTYLTHHQKITSWHNGAHHRSSKAWLSSSICLLASKREFILILPKIYRKLISNTIYVYSQCWHFNRAVELFVCIFLCCIAHR